MLMTEPNTETPRGWLAQRKYPSLVLAILILLLYSPSLLDGFAIDDLRAVRIFSEYHAGQREAINLYRFLRGGEANRVERDAGWYPWWVTEELRYQHLRAVSERVLYAEYLVFGKNALGFRLVSLGLYFCGTLLVLDLFRRLGANEQLARWGAIIFAVAACHAIPVVFISAQCDLIALVLAGGALCGAVRFLSSGSAAYLFLAALLYGFGLFAKEMVLPVAALPLCLGWMLGGGRTIVRRALAATATLGVLGVAWLAFYAVGGYGSNAMVMLDPLHTPAAYLEALPGRALLLLSTWVIPVNPFIFILHHKLGGLLLIYGAIGAVALTALLLLYRRWFRGRRDVWGMALWVIVFLPLLACAAPDDRVMILPSIGFAYLGATWLVRPRFAPPYRVRRLPFVLFIALQAATVPTANFLMGFMEREAQQHLRMMRDTFGRSSRAGDFICFINTTRNFEALFAQDRMREALGESTVQALILSDVAQPEVSVKDEYTLHLESRDPAFFTSYLGQMGSARGYSRGEGDRVVQPEFTASVARVEDHRVTAIELRFAKPLSSDSYRFFWSTPDTAPRLWRATALTSGGRIRP